MGSPSGIWRHSPQTGKAFIFWSGLATCKPLQNQNGTVHDDICLRAQSRWLYEPLNRTSLRDSHNGPHVGSPRASPYISKFDGPYGDMLHVAAACGLRTANGGLATREPLYIQIGPALVLVDFLFFHEVAQGALESGFAQAEFGFDDGRCRLVAIGHLALALL